LTAHRVCDSAVLRQATFCNIQSRHQLDPAHHGVSQPNRHGRRDDTQAPVDAKADGESIGGRLGMEVGRTLVHRPAEQGIDQSNNRRVACRLTQAIQLAWPEVAAINRRILGIEPLGVTLGWKKPIQSSIEVSWQGD
jgi:hypothetical protein